MPTQPKSPRARFSERYTIEESGCWLWTRSANRQHYAKFWDGERSVLAHRFSYEIAKGPIPENLQLDHLCRNRTCVNPDHLEPVTGRENTLRSPISPTAVFSRQTHCVNGHELAGANLYQVGNYRYCRACRRNNNRVYEQSERGRAYKREYRRRRREESCR